MATYHSIYSHGVSQGILRWLEQSGINRGSTNREPIADFIDIFWNLNGSGLLDFELCCSDSSLVFFAIGYHYWTQSPNKLEYESENNILAIILISLLAIIDSHTTHVCLNRETIADQSRCADLQSRSRLLKYTRPFILRSAAICQWYFRAPAKKHQGGNIHNNILNSLFNAYCA